MKRMWPVVGLTAGALVIAVTAVVLFGRDGSSPALLPVLGGPGHTSIGFATQAPADTASAAPSAAVATPTASAKVSPSSAAPGRPPAGWALRWSPSAARDGLGAFEGVEDDRANSEPGVKHIYVQGDTYRFDMHMVQRDTSPDRQRNEVKGMRVGSGYLTMALGETWRFTYDMHIPGSLKATTTFSHIMQLKMPGNGTSPIMTMSLRRTGGVQRIELKLFDSNTVVGSTPLDPLHDQWISTEVEVTIGDAPKGAVHWVVRKGSATLLSVGKSGMDTWLGDRVRPKWGIYRSLGDTSGSLQDCYLLLRNMRAYQKV